jgi:hypothetical protein
MERNRFRTHRNTFSGVLHNCDNQVIVRQLVEFLMTDAQKAEMIRLFNEDVDRYNRVVAEQEAPDANA